MLKYVFNPISESFWTNVSILLKNFVCPVVWYYEKWVARSVLAEMCHYNGNVWVVGGWLRGHGKANVGNCGNMSGNPGVPAVCHGKYYFQNFVIDNFQSLSDWFHEPLIFFLNIFCFASHFSMLWKKNYLLYGQTGVSMSCSRTIKFSEIYCRNFYYCCVRRNKVFMVKSIQLLYPVLHESDINPFNLHKPS